MWNPKFRFPPKTKEVEFSIMEDYYYDSEYLDWKRRACNKDTLEASTEPILRSRVNPKEYPKFEEWERIHREVKFDDEFLKPKSILEEMNKRIFRHKDMSFPMNIDMMEFFMKRQPNCFFEVIRSYFLTGIGNRIKKRRLETSKDSLEKSDDCVSNLIKCQRQTLNEERSELHESKMLRTLSLQIDTNSLEKLAVLLKGFARSLMILHDSKKVNTYLKHPNKSSLYRCHHKIFGHKTCILQGTENQAWRHALHSGIPMTDGSSLPASVAVIKKPIVQHRWQKPENLPKTIEDAYVSSRTSCLCIPLSHDKNEVLAVYEVLRFREYNIEEYTSEDKQKAIDFVGWMATAVGLSLDMQIINEDIVDNKKYNMFFMDKSFLLYQSLDQILNWIPLMVKEEIQAEQVVLISYSAETMYCRYVCDGEIYTEVQSIKGQRYGMHWTCASLTKTVHVLMNQESIKKRANQWLYHTCIEHGISKKSIKQNRIDFLIEPVTIIEQPKVIVQDNEALCYEKAIRGADEDQLIPIRTHKIKQGTVKKEQQVLCVIFAINKKSSKLRFTERDISKLRLIASAVGTILKTVRLYNEMYRKVQLLDLAKEVEHYHSKPNEDEINTFLLKYHRLLISYSYKISFEDNAFMKFDESHQLCYLINIIYNLLKSLEYDLERVVRYCLTLQKHFVKNLAYHNLTHCIVVTQAAYVVTLALDDKLLLWEKLALTFAVGQSMLSNRGLTNEGLRKIHSPLVQLFPKSTAECLCFEIGSQLLFGSEGLFEEASSDEEKRFSKTLNDLLLMGDVDNFKKKKELYEKLPETMDWNNYNLRLALLELLSFLCMREYYYKPPDIALSILITGVMVEYTNEGFEEAENGWDISTMFDANMWRDWPAIWLKMFHSEGLFAARILAKLLPELAHLETAVRNNIDYLKNNGEEVLLRIQRSLHIYPRHKRLQAKVSIHYSMAEQND